MSSSQPTKKRKLSGSPNDVASPKIKRPRAASTVDILTVERRPPGNYARSGFLRASAWTPPVVCPPQPFMFTETGAAAAVLARTIWSQDVGNIDPIKTLLVVASLMTDEDDAEMLQRFVGERDFMSKISGLRHELPLVKLMDASDSDSSRAIETEICSTLAGIGRPGASSPSSSARLNGIIQCAIGVIGDCARQWHTSNRCVDTMAEAGLDACAARAFYVRNLTEFGESRAVTSMVNNPARLAGVVNVMDGVKCSVAKCKRMASKPSIYCTVHLGVIKRKQGKRPDVVDEPGSVVAARKKTLDFILSASAKKLVRSAVNRLRRLRTGAKAPRLTVSSAGKVVVFHKIQEPTTDVTEYDVSRVDFTRRGGRGKVVSDPIPRRFARRLNQLKKRDRKVYVPEVLVLFPFFDIIWATTARDVSGQAAASDDSDFVQKSTSEAVVGTSQLQDCPELMARGIVSVLRRRPDTLAGAGTSGASRVSRHSGLWPDDVRLVVHELNSVLAVLDPVATSIAMSVDNPDIRLDATALRQMVAALTETSVKVLEALTLHDGSGDSASSLASAADTMASMLVDARSAVPRWAAVKQFNTDPVYGSLASIMGAVCLVVDRWSNMPVYTPLNVDDAGKAKAVWNLAHEARETTVTLLGFIANDVSCALDDYPTELSEYEETEVQTVVVLQTYQSLSRQALTPSIIVQISNEPLEKKTADDVGDPNVPGMVRGIVAGKENGPCVEVARWLGCIDPYGYGVRARSAIAVGDVIAEVHFRVVHSTRRDSEFAVLDDDGCTRCLNNRSLVRWINGADFHDSEHIPNCDVVFTSMSGADPTMRVIATSDIIAGDELKMLYGRTFCVPHVEGGVASSIHKSAARCFVEDKTLQQLGRLTGINPAWAEPGIASVQSTGIAWAARRWATVERVIHQRKLVPPDAHFYSVNAPPEQYYSCLDKMAVLIPPRYLVDPRDALDGPIPRAEEPLALSDIFELREGGRRVVGIKDDFSMEPYGASVLSSHGLRELHKIEVARTKSKSIRKRKTQRKLEGALYNECIRDDQPGVECVQATLTDGHIRPLTAAADHATKSLHKHSRLLRADIALSTKRRNPEGPCILRTYLDPSEINPDSANPTQQTLHGMNSCALYASFNHTYEGVWHIEPDSAASLNENVGTEDGFVIMLHDPKAINDVVRLHLFMELAVPGGVDITFLRTGNVQRGVLHSAHRGRSWLSRPPHPKLLSAMGVDTSSLVVYRQRPGDIIYIPGGTLHAVVHKSPSVRVATGYVSMADACRSVIRSEQLKVEGAMSTLWSIAGSVRGGDLDLGVAFNKLAKSHRNEADSARWEGVDMPGLCKLFAECAETLTRTEGFKKAVHPKAKKTRHPSFAQRLNLPTALIVGGGRGATYIVTPSELTSAIDYFKGVSSGFSKAKAGVPGESPKGIPSPRRRPRAPETSRPIAQRLRASNSRLKLKKKSLVDVVKKIPDVVVTSDVVRSGKALSTRSGTRFVPLFGKENLKAVVVAEFVQDVNKEQATKLRNSMKGDVLSMEPTLHVASALLEAACNAVIGGTPRILFQHPAHQDYCRTAIDRGTADEKAEALSTPPIREIPGGTPAVHVFPLHVGQDTPDHFASAICRTDDTSCCYADSLPDYFPATRTSALLNLSECLEKAKFFRVSDDPQFVQADVPVQGDGDMSCLQRSTLNAAVIACYATPPYADVSVSAPQGALDDYYKRWSGILVRLFDDVHPEGNQDNDEDTPLDIDAAVEQATKETVKLLTELRPRE